jgi:polyphosphate kinase
MNFIFLSSILHAHVGDLFPGMVVTGCYQFRLTRNSELFVDEEEVDDLLVL